MYSILIADDERMMREGIAKLLPWNLLNINHVETADSGAKALVKMKAHMPDIVITDIEMKHINGLELIKQMNQMNPNLRIIVLTGHDDFSYVQQCCRMEVHDYLLKPVEQSKLVEVIGQQVDYIEQRAKNNARQKTIERVNSLAEQMRVAQTLYRYLHLKQGESDVRQLLSEYGFERGDAVQVAVVAPSGSFGTEWRDKPELLDLCIQSVCVELVEYNGDGITFRDKNNTLVILLFQGKNHPNSRELLKQLQDVLQNEYDTAQKIYLGREVSGVHQMPASYREAVMLLDNWKKNVTIIQSDEKDPETLLLELSLGFQHEVEGSLNDAEQVLKSYDEYWERVKQVRCGERSLLRSLLHSLMDVYLLWEKQTDSKEETSLVKLIGEFQRKSAMEAYQVGRHFLESLFANQVTDSDDVIENAKRYIQQHLSEELSVTQLATTFYLSVAYFSKLFKKTEGVGCNYYIISQRMEKAKQLLSQRHYHVSEVAKQVGYHDVNYFSLTFKKYTDMTPVEYREE